MKIWKRASGKQEVSLNHQDWMTIGERSGWLDWAEGFGGSGGIGKQAGADYQLDRIPLQIQVEKYSDRT